jgi:hypothetical protein
VNEYHSGDFKGDPNQLMRHYYNEHLYVANWGTHRLKFRLARGLLDPCHRGDLRIDHPAGGSQHLIAGCRSVVPECPPNYWHEAPSYGQ